RRMRADLALVDSSLRRDGADGRAQVVRWAVSCGPARAGEGSDVRAPVRVLQPAGQPGAVPVLGSHRDRTGYTFGGDPEPPAGGSLRVAHDILAVPWAGALEAADRSRTGKPRTHRAWRAP